MIIFAHGKLNFFSKNFNHLCFTRAKNSDFYHFELTVFNLYVD